MRNNKNKILFLSLCFILVILTCIIHKNWIFSLSPLVSGDWPYFFRDQLVTWIPFHPLWINYDSLGRSITQGNFLFLFLLYGYFAKIGANFELISRIFFFLPVVILTPLGSYLAAKQITKKNIAAIVGAMIYSFNTYVIVINGGHMQLSMNYALAPFVYLFAARRTYKSLIWMFVFLAISCLYDIRMTMLVYVFGITIALFYRIRERKDIIKIISLLAVGTFALVLFNSFWILPQRFSHSNQFTSNPFSQASLDWVSQEDAFTLHHPFWSGSGVTDFVFQTPSVIMYIIPAAVIVPFVFENSTKKREMFFYMSIALLSMLLLLQNNSVLGNEYQFIYNHVSLLSAFRESTKIYFITSYCFSILIAVFISELYRRKVNSKYVVITCAVLIFALTVPLKTFFEGNYVKAYKAEPISSDMAALNSAMSGTGRYRILWVSRTPKFAHLSFTNPGVDALNLGQVYWDRYTDNSDPFGYLKGQYSGTLLGLANFKYVVVPNDDIDSNYQNYNYLPSDYYRAIVSKLGFEKIKENGAGTIWENSNYKPYMYFSTNTFAVDTIPVFSGIDTSKTNAYIFKNQNLNNNYNGVVTNIEKNPFQADNLIIDNGKVYTNYQIENGDKFNLYVKNNDGFSVQKNITSLKSESINVKGLSQTNLYRNGSFENKKLPGVHDCNNFNNLNVNNTGITSAIVSDATDGKSALQITAKIHTACFSQKVMKFFNPNSSYLLSFDYKTEAGKRIQVSLYPYNQDPKNRYFQVPKNDNQWHKFSTVILPGQFSKKMYLIFYLSGNDNNANLSKALLDNITLYALPNIPYGYLRTSNKDLAVLHTKSISDTATHHTLDVSNLNDTRLFVFSETYSHDWQLKISSTSSGNKTTWIVPENDHIMVNSFANGWQINPNKFPKQLQNSNGNYKFSLTYVPEKWFIKGILITILIIVSFIAFLTYDVFIRRKTYKKSHYVAHR